MAGVGWGSALVSGDTGRPGGWVELLFGGGLDGAEDAGHLTLESGELEIDDAAARVEDYVDRRAKGGEIVADGLAHAAIDAIAIDGLAHDFTDGEADAGA